MNCPLCRDTRYIPDPKNAQETISCPDCNPLEIPINQLRPGQRFRAGDVTGRLIYVNFTRAYIELELGTTEVQLKDRKGKTRSFTAKKKNKTSWQPEAPVVPIEG
jgi:hypothetical protein